MVVAVSEDMDINDAEDVYHAIATRADPSRDIFTVANTRSSPYDLSASPNESGIFRNVGKIGIDATRKSRHNSKDFDRTWPKHWGEVDLNDFL
jgi:4-hydroxy-3-polyprenylbenzoate decarboxylase